MRELEQIECFSRRHSRVMFIPGYSLLRRFAARAKAREAQLILVRDATAARARTHAIHTRVSPKSICSCYPGGVSNRTVGAPCAFGSRRQPATRRSTITGHLVA